MVYNELFLKHDTNAQLADRALLERALLLAETSSSSDSKARPLQSKRRENLPPLRNQNKALQSLGLPRLLNAGFGAKTMAQ
jgi:hypothetical protein